MSKFHDTTTKWTTQFHAKYKCDEYFYLDWDHDWIILSFFAMSKRKIINAICLFVQSPFWVLAKHRPGSKSYIDRMNQYMYFGHVLCILWIRTTLGWRHGTIVASLVTNTPIVCWTAWQLYDCSKENFKTPVYWPWPRNAESMSMPWRHHEFIHQRCDRGAWSSIKHRSSVNQKLWLTYFNNSLLTLSTFLNSLSTDKGIEC